MTYNNKKINKNFRTPNFLKFGVTNLSWKN